MRAVLSSGIQRRVVDWKSNDASEEHTAYIFMVKKSAKQETSAKAAKAQIPHSIFLHSIGKRIHDYAVS
jgi:hypothetical protein